LVHYSEKSKDANAMLVATVHTAPEKSSSVWDEFDKSVCTFVRNPHPRAAALIEDNKFNKESLLPRTENQLTWWFERRQVYPALFKLAKKDCVLLQLSSLVRECFQRQSRWSQRSEIIFLAK
jgi:hypothetical protein